MEGEAGVLQQRVHAVPVERGGPDAVERVRGQQAEQLEAAAVPPSTPSTRARSAGGRVRPNTATAAPQSARIRHQSRMEPSWFPQVPVIL